ncbi:HAD family hydrolase [Viridibacterium curvum]|uniref:HAD family hydrolase n=1 Tax=Viridibacterium curvum TaxID=1101404 RepID=A0ABP9QA17_9RHOO
MNLALFDLDNTLLRGDSDHAWGEFICERGAVNRAEYEARNNEFYEHYKAGTLDNAAFLRFVMAPLAAIPRAQLDALHAEFMQSRIAGMMLPQGQALVRKHLDAGDLVAIVTATNAFITAPIVRAFGVSHCIATIPAQENGRFTGEPRGLPAFKEGKITRVNTWLESLALNLQSFDKTWFYSDSLNDLPLLSLVTNPVAVDPDPTLRAHAEKSGWSVISLR